MENPLFPKLQEAVERPCRSKEWFPMAEQAINTIYALGERPDLVCTNIIKNLTRRAFSRKPSGGSQSQSRSQESVAKDPDSMDEDKEDVDPDTTQASQAPTDDGKDTGDAFELAQLLFVVGHVAIKQIVFLELVEREWKRQKHEKEMGKSWHTWVFGVASSDVSPPV